MRLAHLLVIIVPECLLTLVLVGVLAGAGGRRVTAGELAVVTVGALGVSLALAWPLCRVCGVPPLMMLAGPCPHCHKRPRGWWSRPGPKPSLDLRCGACGQPVRVWLTRTPPRGIASTHVPTYVLRWPEFLGLWRPIAGGSVAARKRG